MTVENAITMVRWLRDWELYGVRMFSERPFDETSMADKIRMDMLEISKEKADRLANVLAELQTVKQQRLPKKCRHPKRDHDVTADGQRYCMNCNADL